MLPREGGCPVTGLWGTLRRVEDTEVADCAVELADGRTIAWTDVGPADGVVVLRFPGTPGSRWSIRADRRPWRDRSVRMITGERPGYGRSTRLPGRGFAEHADDMARLLDHLGLDRVYVCGQSGGAPRALALAARHPDRARVASVLSGMAPLTDEEATQVIPINQRARRLVAAHDVDGLRTLLTPIAAEMLADPLAGYAAQMATAPPEDHTVMTDPLWQQGYIRATREALGTGIDGWVDETLAILGRLADVPLPAVTTSLVWYHAHDDRNVPLLGRARAR